MNFRVTTLHTTMCDIYNNSIHPLEVSDEAHQLLFRIMQCNYFLAGV